MADEEEMSRLYEEWKREVLLDLREELVLRIEPERFFPLLRAKKVFDEEDEQIIKHEITTRRQAGKFLDLLSKKGQLGFDMLCEGLRTRVCGQLDLLKRILKAFEKKLEDLSELDHMRELPSLVLSSDLPVPGQIGGPELIMEYSQIALMEPPPAYVEYER